MKKITTLFLSAISSILIGQIPNPSFENWTSGTPNGWYVASPASSITQSSTAHAGNFAVSINSVLNGPFYAGGYITTSGPSYFVNPGNPIAFNGWYIANLNGGDYFVAIAGNKCANDSNNGIADFGDTTNTVVYKQFSACFSYAKSCTSDSAAISFYIDCKGHHTHAGSYVIVDDLTWGLCATGIDEVQRGVTLESAYPVPASKECNIIYSIPGNSNVSVSLYDLTGKKVKSILEKTLQSPGRYKIPVNVSDLSNGFYIYNIVVDGVPYSQKLTVAK